MKEVIVVTGAGQLGQAIVRRIGAGKHVLLADMRESSPPAGSVVLCCDRWPSHPGFRSAIRLIPFILSWCRAPPWRRLDLFRTRRVLDRINRIHEIQIPEGIPWATLSAT